MPKKPKVDLLDINDDVYSKTADFDALQLTLKEDGLWHFKLSIKAALPQTFREYQAALTLNERPFLDSIAESSRDKENVESSTDLFDDQKKKNIKAVEKEIAEKESALKAAKETHPDIAMTFTVESIAWKDDGVQVVAIIPAEVINFINERRLEISQGVYQIKLTH